MLPLLPEYASALSNTLEVRSYLNFINARGPLVEAVLEAFEKFLVRLSLGQFTLRNKDALKDDDRRRTMCRTLAAVSGMPDDAVTIVSTSLNELIGKPPEAQSVTYTIAEVGSVARTLNTVLIHKTHLELLPKAAHVYQGEVRGVGLERRVRSALNTVGLKQVLLDTRFGGFTKIFEKSVVAFFTAILAHAYAGDARSVERLLPLYKLFYTNMPIGALPKLPGDDTTTWMIFTE